MKMQAAKSKLLEILSTEKATATAAATTAGGAEPPLLGPSHDGDGGGSVQSGAAEPPLLGPSHDGDEGGSVQSGAAEPPLLGPGHDGDGEGSVKSGAAEPLLLGPGHDGDGEGSVQSGAAEPPLLGPGHDGDGEFIGLGMLTKKDSDTTTVVSYPNDVGTLDQYVAFLRRKQGIIDNGQGAVANSMSMPHYHTWRERVGPGLAWKSSVMIAFSGHTLFAVGGEATQKERAAKQPAALQMLR